MSNIGFIPVTTVTDEWIEDNNLDQELINYEKLKRQGIDCTHWLTTTQQLRYKLALFVVNEYGKVELPDEYRTIQQVAYRIPKSKKDCTTQGEIVGWVQHDYNSGLDVEVTIKCPKCGEKACKCGKNRPIIIDLDDYWNRRNMIENVSSRMATKTRFGAKHTDSSFNDRWQIMRHSINDFRNNELPDCLDFDFRECDGSYSYVIDHPYIATDLPKGAEILISYLAVDVDNDGDIMIPDHPDSIEAIKNHLSSKHFESMYFQTLEQRYLQASALFEAKRERSIELSRSALQQPEFLELYSILDQVFNRRLNGEGKKLETHHSLQQRQEDKWLT